MIIKRIKCGAWEENCYIISQDNVAIIIDPGDNVDKIIQYVQDKYLTVKAILNTHAHFDHICGINDIIDKFPECVVYCAEYANEGLLSDKLNLSFYHLEPLVFKGGCVTLLVDGMSIELFANYYLKVLETVGHNKGSLSFIFPGGIFTGDALIPGVKIVTKLKSGNKEDAIESVLKIRKALHPNHIIYPGHGPVCRKSEVDWCLYGDRNQY